MSIGKKVPAGLTGFVRRWFWPLMPGWPDEGRRIVQKPCLEALLRQVAARSPQSKVYATYNAGAGECGYSPLLLGMSGVELAAESDFGWRSGRPPSIDPKQVFFCASLTAIPLVPEKFDLVLCTEVLEHVAEHHEALDELARILRPGGWLLITVPTPPAIPDPAHVREGYRLSELAEMLRDRGLEVMDSAFCMHFFFRMVLRLWPHLWWRPRGFIRSFSYLDRLLPIGPPMDLMVLARKAERVREVA
jgi:SAM-dependent methyltransferase